MARGGMVSDYAIQQGSVQEVGLRCSSLSDLMSQGACRVTRGTLCPHEPLCTQGWSVGQEQQLVVVRCHELGLGSKAEFVLELGAHGLCFRKLYGNAV